MEKQFTVSLDDILKQSGMFELTGEENGAKVYKLVEKPDENKIDQNDELFVDYK